MVLPYIFPINHPLMSWSKDGKPSGPVLELRPALWPAPNPWGRPCNAGPPCLRALEKMKHGVRNVYMLNYQGGLSLVDHRMEYSNCFYDHFLLFMIILPKWNDFKVLECNAVWWCTGGFLLCFHGKNTSGYVRSTYFQTLKSELRSIHPVFWYGILYFDHWIFHLWISLEYQGNQYINQYRSINTDQSIYQPILHGFLWNMVFLAYDGIFGTHSTWIRDQHQVGCEQRGSRPISWLGRRRGRQLRQLPRWIFWTRHCYVFFGTEWYMYYNI